jgi:hypothetical protein
MISMTTFLERENAYLATTGIPTTVEELSKLDDAHTKALLRVTAEVVSVERQLLDLGDRIVTTTADVAKRLHGPQPGMINTLGELQSLASRYDIACADLNRVRHELAVIASLWTTTRAPSHNGTEGALDDQDCDF